MDHPKSDPGFIPYFHASTANRIHSLSGQFPRTEIISGITFLLDTDGRQIGTIGAEGKIYDNLNNLVSGLGHDGKIK